MATREELLKAARRKLLLEQARAKMASTQTPVVESEPTQEEPAPTPQAPEFTTEGSGFLGASVKDSVPLGEHLMSAAKGLEAVGQNLPIVGPMAERGAMALNNMTPEQYEAYKAKSAEQHPVATQAGEAVGSIGPYAAIPGVGLGSLAASLGVSGADQAMRGKSAGEIGANLAQEGIVGGATMGLGKLLKKLPSSEELLELAGKKAESAAGLDLSKSARKNIATAEITGDIKPGELGNKLLDLGIVKPFQSARKTAEAAHDASQRYSDEISKLLEGSEDIPIKDLVKNIKAQKTGEMYTSAAEDAIIKKADDEIVKLSGIYRTSETTDSILKLKESLRKLGKLDASDQNKRKLASVIADTEHKQVKAMKDIAGIDASLDKLTLKPPSLKKKELLARREKLEKSIPKLQDILDNTTAKLEELTPLNPEIVKQQISKAELDLKNLEDMVPTGGLSPKRIQEIKDSISKEVDILTTPATTKAGEKALSKAYRDTIEESLGAKELERLKELNKNLQASKTAMKGSIESSASKPSALGQYTSMYSLSKGDLAFPTIYASKNLWGTYGNSLAAVGIKKGAIPAKYLGQFAEAAEKGGKTAVGALHFKLMQEDPEYRKKHTKKED